MAQQIPATANLAHDQSSSQTVKRRAACDECRTRKLKCTGEQPACSRCLREDISCLYSPQKQMGRPKKRTQSDDAATTSPPKKARSSDPTTWDPEDGDFAESINIETAFTPGGSLQPWLQWNNEFSTDDSYGGVPDLTPDNSASHSPPMLNLPPELQMTHPSTVSLHTHQNNSTNLLLDSGLGASAGIPPGLIPNCACLSTMYLTLNTLQSMQGDEAFMFPMALHPLREAMRTASSVLACEECPTRFITALQNTQLVGTLLMSICERFGKVLENITSASVRAELAGEKKKFRLADLNSSTSHLHTGGLGCVAAFSLNLSPEEWRAMAKKVVRAEVEGPSEGNDCCCYLMGIIKQMEDRQDRWHKRPATEDSPRDREGALIKATDRREDRLCLKLVKFARTLVEEFDWS